MRRKRAVQVERRERSLCRRAKTQYGRASRIETNETNSDRTPQKRLSFFANVLRLLTARILSTMRFVIEGSCGGALALVSDLSHRRRIMGKRENNNKHPTHLIIKRIRRQREITLRVHPVQRRALGRGAVVVVGRGAVVVVGRGSTVGPVGRCTSVVVEQGAAGAGVGAGSNVC